MKLINACKLLLVLCLTFNTLSASAQSDKSPSQLESQLQVVSALKQAINDHYVDKDKVQLINQRLDSLSQVPQGQMDNEEFAAELTKTLQLAAQDKHLRVEFSERAVEPKPVKDLLLDFENESEKAMWQSHNMGFDKLERLPFNIGYLKLSAFAPVEHAAPMLAAAFTFVNNSNSLIIDLRGNFGGFEYTGNLLASYFLEKKTHLVDMHWRKGDRIEQRWSSEKVAGPKYDSSKKVYLLVDKNTFSAGEALSYTMKHLGIATIVGERTAGAANAGESVYLSPHFSAFIPMRKLVSPITKTSFEGNGVKPHLRSNSDDALKVAQIDYLNALKDQSSDPRRQARIEARLQALAE